MTVVKKTADSLERGDVIWYSGIKLDPSWLPHTRNHGASQQWVVCEPSDHVDTLPQDRMVRFGSLAYPASQCCEPRLQLLGRTGRATHMLSYTILPSRLRVRVIAFLDLDIQSAVPEPVQEAR